MATRTGTHDLTSLLANNQTSAAAFGLDNIQPILAADIEAHNAMVQEVFRDIADTTSDRQRLAGASGGGEMIEVDDYGRSPTQKEVPGATVGFPLRLMQYAIGWTRKWFEIHTPADMALATQAAEKAHLKALVRDMKRAIFVSANYTFRDRLIAPQVDLAVKRLVNADSFAIPDGPNGESFDASTHTHYTSEATLTAANLLASINTVVEHGFGGRVITAISTADQAAVEALTGFQPYVDARLIPSEGDPRTQTNVTRLNNRAIGIFGPAEVWVKPWAITEYAFTWDADAASKPLVLRTRPNRGPDLRIAAELDAFPLHAQYMEAEYGFGVWTRTNGAVHHFGDALYVDPTIS